MVVLFDAYILPPFNINAQSINPDPPAKSIKLIFIHHSTGENWLADDNGGLGLELGSNNYFVSDTNYGWGPDSIGDLTDYFNWIDWFIGPQSQVYLDALYNESGRHSNYTRSLSDPGGENKIIMFKSCFPNSDLSGNPNDPAMDGEWNTVGHAKFVYNQLLNYFQTRPDKLFIAITPPPLLDHTNAENAREFSRWLSEDWLTENNYTLNNVAVWDFHNILTHPDNVHRVDNGVITHEYLNGDGTLYYDSDGDEHPNITGNKKATEEFVPMLNVFYNRWIQTAPDTPYTTDIQIQSTHEIVAQATEEPTSSEINFISSTGIIDDFEGGIPTGSNGWEAYWDEVTNSKLTCEIDDSISKSGISSLRLDFQIQPNGWATCPLFFETPVNFEKSNGISFDYHSSSQGLLFNFDALVGNPDNFSSYYFTIESVPDSVENWVHFELTWDQIVGVDWEANPGISIDPSSIIGLSFGFSTYTDTPNDGTIWIDNLSTFGEESTPPNEDTESETPTDLDSEILNPSPEAETKSMGDIEQPQEGGNIRSLCPGSVAFISLALFGFLLIPKLTKNRG